MSEPARVGLIFGGRSVEHEVSVQSARSVARAMGASGLTAVPIAVTGDGRWLSAEVSGAVLQSEAVRADAPEVRGDGARLVIDTAPAGLARVDREGRLVRLDVDVVFPLIHGWGGEDGRLQGALELAGIAYVGAGVLGSAVAMDKAVAKRLFAAAGLPQVRWVEIEHSAYREDPRAWCRRVAEELGFPQFVKPANGGSSVGVGRVSDPGELPGALDKAFACDLKVVVEAGVDGREIECAVIGNERPQASVLGEIEPSSAFYDYRAKYVDATSRLLIPAELDGETAQRIRETAIEAYRCLDLRGFARVDFLVDRGAGEIFLNEINTLPGFTRISMFPRLWEASGMPYPELVKTLVRLALERQRAERRLRTTLDEN